MIELAGNYLLRFELAGTTIPMSFDMIREFTIIQDMNKFLPLFRFSVHDPTGLFVHTLPSDKTVNKMYVEVGKSISEELDNSFNFLVYRKFPESQSRMQAIFEISGLLDNKMLFDRDLVRGFSGKISETLEKIAKEIGCDSVDISPSLNYSMNLVQGMQTNAKFLKDLRQRLSGRVGEHDFRCFVKRVNHKNVFVFRALKELINASVKKKYVMNDVGFEDREPMFDFQVVDSFGVLSSFGVKIQKYEYFDWDNRVYITDKVDLSDFMSLTDYFLIEADAEETSRQVFLGRSSIFDYKVQMKSKLSKRLMNLLKMWILVPGDINVAPGDLVDVLIPDAMYTGDPYVFQYAGLWMVERVVHSLTSSHRMRLLLTRNGIDTTMPTTLLKAGKKKGY
jgi:hypothetical protein